MATEPSTIGEERIGDYRLVRMIHPGATSVVIEVIKEGTQTRYALKQLLASRARTGMNVSSSSTRPGLAWNCGIRTWFGSTST